MIDPEPERITYRQPTGDIITLVRGSFNGKMYSERRVNGVGQAWQGDFEEWKRFEESIGSERL